MRGKEGDGMDEREDMMENEPADYEAVRDKQIEALGRLLEERE